MRLRAVRAKRRLVLCGLLAAMVASTLLLTWSARHNGKSVTVAGASQAPGSALPVLDRRREPLVEVWTPLPPRLPVGPGIATMLHGMRLELGTARGQRFLQNLIPSQSGILWLSVAILFVTLVDWRRPLSSRHWDLFLLQALACSLYGSMWFFERTHVPAYVTLMDGAFIANFAVAILLMLRAVRRAVRPAEQSWEPAIDARAARALAVLLLASNVAVLAIHTPDDSSTFVNLGAQRLRERLRFPYGDPLLTGTPGAAYGPVMYMAQASIQVLVDPTPVNALSPDLPKLGEDSTYWLPSMAASRLFLALAHALGLWALWRLLRDDTTRTTAWCVFAAFCASPFVLGIGGNPGEDQVCGLTFASHVFPPALVLLALTSLEWPGLSGAWLAGAAGAGFYPMLLVPAWVGYYSRRHAGLGWFLAGFLGVGLAIGGLVLVGSRPAPGLGLVQTIVRDTLGHHTDPMGYGRSAFGFWGQRTDARRWWRTPVLPGQAETAPMMLGLFALAVASGVLARNRTRPQLALLAAAVVLGSTLVKVHATGTYGMWWLALLLYGTFAHVQPPTTRS